MMLNNNQEESCIEIMTEFKEQNLGKCKKNDLRIIGITGEVVSGKSTFAKIYAKIHDAYIIFTDNVAKDLQVEGNTCYNLIVEHFGNVILNEDKSINRACLAEIVFQNEDELDILNSFVHREVLEKVKAMIEDISLNGKYHTILIESAILFQVEELKNLCSEIWYVESNTQNRRERLKRERNYSDERIQMMMESQECIHLCREKCDKVIINDKGQDTLEEILAKL